MDGVIESIKNVDPVVWLVVGVITFIIIIILLIRRGSGRTKLPRVQGELARVLIRDDCLMTMAASWGNAEC